MSAPVSPRVVVPSLAVGDDQAALADSVARLLADSAPVAAVREHYGAAPPDTEQVWRKLAGLGVPGALVAEGHGGLGLTLCDLGGVLEVAGRALYQGPLVSTAVAAVNALSPSDDELLEPLAAGETLVAVAVDAALETTGERVSGHADYVPDAPLADVFLLAAPDGFWVVRREAGVTVEPVVSIDGSRTIGHVRLADAPARKVAADPAGVADVTAVAACADGYGAAAAALEQALAHAAARRQFGVPVGSFQAVQHLLVDAFTTLRLAGLAVKEALTEPTPGRVAVARALCRDGLPAVGAAAIQVMGGIGYSWESDTQLFYKRLLGLQATGPTTDEELDRLAALVVDSA